ncbi:hypothetical protein AMTR_s00066p00095800 [Amborella trichopoda]|uniref:Uncharacterized protein n=1 Tax=Amborella trichopoda TaxID=13333 RepID=U5DD71_AMBTC|nr:hypothetical protein AMTR_s00066p00095800 [Amborella trichopoda]
MAVGGMIPSSKNPPSCNALPLCEQQAFKKSKDPPCNPHPLYEDEISKAPRNPSLTDFETSDLLRDLEEEEVISNIRPTPTIPPTTPEKKSGKNKNRVPTHGSFGYGDTPSSTHLNDV